MAHPCSRNRAADPLNSTRARDLTDRSTDGTQTAMTPRRDTLIETATELFLGRGYGAVGTADLCRAAGVNKGTLYHFFPSKLELLIAAIDRYARSFAEAFQSIADSSAAPEDKLRRLFDVPTAANRDWMARHGHAQGCLVGNISLELAAGEAQASAAVRRAFHLWAGPVGQIIDQLMAASALHSVDRDQAALCVISMIQGGLLMAKARNDPAMVALTAPTVLAALNALPTAAPD